MHLAEILIGRKVLPISGMFTALERQHRFGGKLGDKIIALGLLTAEQYASELDAVILKTPPSPGYIPERPKGMHKRTYNRLATQLEGAIEAHEGVFSVWAARVMSKFGRPK